MISELCTLATARRELEAGRDVETACLSRLEQAALANFGYLGRVADEA